jgi:MFS family permease
MRAKYPAPPVEGEMLQRDDARTFEAVTYAKVARRLIPFLMLCYLGAYLDRVNVGFAKLQMLNDLRFSETVYGMGAGIFFLGYFLFEVPSNLILHRVGARRWLARIMLTWAVISASFVFVKSPTAFYVLRFALGVAEAGFAPGVILYLTYWFPSATSVPSKKSRRISMLTRRGSSNTRKREISLPRVRCMEKAAVSCSRMRANHGI